MTNEELAARLEKIRNIQSTHWDDCWKEHDRCALFMRIDHLEDELNDVKKYLSSSQVDAMKEIRDERDALREEVKRLEAMAMGHERTLAELFALKKEMLALRQWSEEAFKIMDRISKRGSVIAIQDKWKLDELLVTRPGKGEV